MIIGFLGNLGDPDSSLKKTGSGATGTANSGMIRRLCVCGRTGTKRRRSQGIAKRRKRSAARRLSGSRSVS
jgi:hypothetical protein